MRPSTVPEPLVKLVVMKLDVVVDVNRVALLTTLMLYEAVETADKELKICALQLTEKLSVVNPAGRRADPNATAALERSVAWVPPDVTYANKYRSGKFESLHRSARNVNVSTNSVPLDGVTLKLPGCGGVLTVTEIDPED